MEVTWQKWLFFFLDYRITVASGVTPLHSLEVLGKHTQLCRQCLHSCQFTSGNYQLPRVKMFSAFLVFPAWNVSVWPVDDMSCVIASLYHLGSSCGESWLSAPSLLKVPRPGYQSRSCIWRDLPWFSVVGCFFFFSQICSKRWNSDHVNNSCVSYNKESHFFSGYGLLVAVENVYKGNGMS